MADEEKQAGPVAFDVICALPKFCRLVKRSSTLGGSLPLRAAQHCSPVLEGNTAGFQIVVEHPMTLRRTRRGVKAELDPATAETLRGRDSALDRVVRAGVLERDGYWHRFLRSGEFPITGSRLCVWSGFLVRPRAHTWLRVSRAFNRGSKLRVVEHLIADASAFAPLIIEIDVRSLRPRPTWIEGEIGCVLPVSPNVSISLNRLTRASGMIESFERFYDPTYFAEKSQHATGKYRKLIRGPDDTASDGTCAAEAFYLGPNVHEVRRLNRFCAPIGMMKRGPRGEAGFPLGVVRNVGRIRARWNGQAFTEAEIKFDRARASFQRAWQRAGGTRGGEAFAFLEHYFFDPAYDEPYWLLQPWVFVRTAPGWSTVMDGCEVPGCSGLRGITRTDIFHPMAMVFRLYLPQPFTILNRRPLLHFHPLPRNLQNAQFALVTL